jgi:hypothetical protein
MNRVVSTTNILADELDVARDGSPALSSGMNWPPEL